MTTPVVLVTGALTGIGRATAEAFAKRGGKVVVSGRHPDAGEALAKALDAVGYLRASRHSPRGRCAGAGRSDG